MLTISEIGIVHYISLQDSMPVAMSVQGSMAFARNTSLFEQGHGGTLGIAARIFDWGEAGYGADAAANATLFDDMAESARLPEGRKLALRLRGFWAYMDRCVTLVRKAHSKSPSLVASLPKSLVFPSTFAEVTLSKVLGFEGDAAMAANRLEVKNGLQRYKSIGRSLAVLLCGWPEKSMVSSLGIPRSFLDAKEILADPRSAPIRIHALERRVMVHVFEGEFTQAVSLLHAGVETLRNVDKASADALHLASIAISGYPRGSASTIADTEASVLWCRSCSMLLEVTKKHFPMLYAALAFLVVTCGRRTSGDIADAGWFHDDPYACVLNCGGISVFDRIAFGCRYLPDLHLKGLLEQYRDKAVAEGVLEGLIVTGCGKIGVDLLQKYLDKTGDVQTATLIASNIDLANVPYLAASRVKRWTEEYREMLNGWKLWEVRARFDVSENSRLRAPKSKKIIPRMAVKCRYCDRSMYWEDLLDGETHRF